LGENGAGKTTTLRMLATMLKPTEGTAILGDSDILKDPSGVRKKIGILFGGETGLYDRLTARENITYFAQLNDIDPKMLKTRIVELTKYLSMEEFIDRKVAKLSKGMKQKVAIARSIVHNPSIMLFDEATSGLDISAARTIHDFIHQCKAEGKAVIFSSHSMAEVEKICDRIGIIRRGQLVAIGTVEEFKKRHGMNNLEDTFIKMVGDQS
jgi:sodium transport system ATP-binding protein